MNEILGVARVVVCSAPYIGRGCEKAAHGQSPEVEVAFPAGPETRRAA